MKTVTIRLEHKRKPIRVNLIKYFIFKWEPIQLLQRVCILSGYWLNLKGIMMYTSNIDITYIHGSDCRKVLIQIEIELLLKKNFISK